MLPYWFLFAAYAVGGVFYGVRTQQQRLTSPLFLLAATLMALLVGLRYEVGTDWENYLGMYDVVRTRGGASLWRMSDPAYMALNALAISIEADIWLVNLICGAIFTSGLIAFARRQPNPWLTVAVAVPYLVIVVAMGYTRQSAAIGLLMWAIGNFEDRRFVRFVGLMLLATAFHKSAVFVLPLIVLSSVRNRFVIYTVGGLIAAVAFSLFLGRFLAGLTDTYIESNMSSQGAIIRVLMNVVPALIFLFLQRRFTVNEQERLMWRNFALAAVGSVLALALLPSTAVDRLALYLIPLQMIVLARAPYALAARGQRRNEQVLIGVLVYSAAIQSVWLIFSQYSRYWVPYQLWPT